MNHSDIPFLRLQNQYLSYPDFKNPAEVVSWFGAVQAQDYLGALWAIGQRMKNGTEKDVEDALRERTIVRSWPMRGTLHFVAAKDLRWMLKLLAPRVMRRASSRYRELELNEETFNNSRKIIVQALVGGKELKREEIFSLLEKNGISPSGQRGIHIIGHLAMEGVICFGNRNGKQFTFTLLDEWIPVTAAHDEEKSLAEITLRYFTSHGPATIKDFYWWSGLTITEAKKGLDLAKKQLDYETTDKDTYWFSNDTLGKQKQNHAWLLPAYDEYTVAYKNRSDIITSQHFIQAGNGLRPTIVFGGQIIGTWKRELKKHTVIITPHFFYEATVKQRSSLHKAAEHYGKFLKRKIELL